MRNIKESETHVVVECTSGLGNTYEVGYPKAAGYTRENIEAELLRAGEMRKAGAADDAGAFSPVNWDAGGDSTTSRAAIRSGIVGGYVVFINPDPAPLYRYVVNFANDGGWGFTFKDLSNDTYGCTTPRNGNHYFHYNSPAPTIVGVR